MRPRELCNKLNEFLEEGLSAGVFLAIQPHLLSGPSRLESLSPAIDVGMISEGGVSVPEFIELLETNRYSAVFHDHAILIVQCIFAAGQLHTHRYCYIPCPFDQDILTAKPQDVALADWLREGMTAHGVESFRSLGTYRFDCVRRKPEKNLDPHPICHFTFASPDCRVPVRAPMSISDFMNFLFDNFYRPFGRFWRDFAPYLCCVGTDQTITLDEQMVHHLSWVDSP